MLPVYYVCCIYPNTLQNTSTAESNIVEPGQTAAWQIGPLGVNFYKQRSGNILVANLLNSQLSVFTFIVQNVFLKFSF